MPTPARADKKTTTELKLSGVVITHPGRVISEDGPITKSEVAEYFATIAPHILFVIAGRPLSLLRCPSGVGNKCFYQRNHGKGLGAHVKTFEFLHKSNKYEYLYVEDEKGLMEIIQMGAIELHPWGARVEAIDCPDRMIFDLDPAPDVPFESVKAAAQELRERLERKGLDSFVKCTGGKGLHVMVPLDARSTWPAVKAFAAALAGAMVGDSPTAYVANMRKAKRTGKTFIDYFRNDYTATAIADYAIRARPRLPVACPLEWHELKCIESADQFTMQAVVERLSRTHSRACSTRARQSLPASS